jgi:hypothetical protein
LAPLDAYKAPPCDPAAIRLQFSNPFLQQKSDMER